MNYYFISKKRNDGVELYGARVKARNLAEAKESEIFKRELESIRGTTHRLEIHKLPVRKYKYIIRLFRNGEPIFYDEVYAVSERGAKLTGGYMGIKKLFVAGDRIDIECDYKDFYDF